MADDKKERRRGTRADTSGCTTERRSLSGGEEDGNDPVLRREHPVPRAGTSGMARDPVTGDRSRKAGGDGSGYHAGCRLGFFFS